MFFDVSVNDNYYKIRKNDFIQTNGALSNSGTVKESENR